MCGGSFPSRLKKKAKRQLDGASRVLLNVTSYLNEARKYRGVFSGKERELLEEAFGASSALYDRLMYRLKIDARLCGPNSKPETDPQA